LNRYKKIRKRIRRN